MRLIALAWAALVLLAAPAAADVWVELDDPAAAGRIETALGGAAVEPMFDGDRSEIVAERRSLERDTGRRLPDLSRWFVAHVDSADRLRGLEGVTSAIVAPTPAPLPVTPDFTSFQGYRTSSAANGFGFTDVQGLAGADGANVRVGDIEYSWNFAHEDLPAAQFVPVLTPADPFNDTNHGTAVAGVMVGAPNTFGVTGVVPAAQPFMFNAATGPGPSVLPQAIDVARGALTAGDVLLIEQQFPGANGGCNTAAQTGCVAPEFFQPVHAAIKLATAKGITVVETAGNGAENLDAAGYGNPFPEGRTDSGAIIVGAGAAPSCSGRPVGSRLPFSTHGARVDLQAWGECITTTGYGLLHGATLNERYTGAFGGTSGAAPIVAGAAAALSSRAETLTAGNHLTPDEIRSALKSTGLAQDTTSGGALQGNIGRRPDLASAFAAAFAPPANDAQSFAVALGLPPQNRTGDSRFAGVESGEHAPSCAPVGKSIWYRYVPDRSGRLRVSTAGSDYDTVLAVLDGVSGVELACSDDAAGQASVAETEFTADRPVLLQVAGFRLAGAVPANGKLALAVDPLRLDPVPPTPDPVTPAASGAPPGSGSPAAQTPTPTPTPTPARPPTAPAAPAARRVTLAESSGWSATFEVALPALVTGAKLELVVSLGKRVVQRLRKAPARRLKWTLPRAQRTKLRGKALTACVTIVGADGSRGAAVCRGFRIRGPRARRSS